MSIIVMPRSNVDPFEAMVRQDYVSGKIGLDQFEEEIELVLRGEIPQRLFGGLSPFPRFKTETVLR